jgi:hypothetical protein
MPHPLPLEPWLGTAEILIESKQGIFFLTILFLFETKSVDNLVAFKYRLNFLEMHCVNVVGLEGGLVLFWRK